MIQMKIFETLKDLVKEYEIELKDLGYTNIDDLNDFLMQARWLCFDPSPDEVNEENINFTALNLFAIILANRRCSRYVLSFTSR